jgi:hypothetical protein
MPIVHGVGVEMDDGRKLAASGKPVISEQATR